jgi:simple sugar transport system permease protein
MAVTAPPATAPPEDRARRSSRITPALMRLLTLREGSIILITVFALIFFSVSVGRFHTGGNFKNLLPYFAPYAILAAGEVFVMITGEIDLSIGAMYLFTPFLFQKIDSAGIPLIPAMILALIIVSLLGAANGFAVAYLGISSFVTTLGMLFVLDGVTLVMSHATPINTPGTAVVGVNTFSQIFGEGTYSELIWAVGIVVILQLVLVRSRWGLYTIAVGGNRHGAAEAGIRVRSVLIRNFMLAAVLAGFTGILEAVRVSTATPDPSASNDILFQAIAAAVIGGTLLRGGSGTVVGALIGALFLGILRDGLILKGVSANYLSLWLGIAILIAMAANTYVARVRTGSGRG